MRLCIVSMKDVAFAPARLDVLRQVRVALYLAAQAKHKHIDVAVNEAVAFRAEAIKDMGSADRFIRRFCKHLKKRNSAVVSVLLRSARQIARRADRSTAQSPSLSAFVSCSRSGSFSTRSEGAMRRRTAFIRAVSSMGSKGLTT